MSKMEPMEPSDYIIDKQMEAVKEYEEEIVKLAKQAREELEHGNLHDVENLLLAIEDYLQ